MNNLSNNWQIKSLGEIVTDIKNGKPAHANFLSYEIKFLRVTDITPR